VGFLRGLSEEEIHVVEISESAGSRRGQRTAGRSRRQTAGNAALPAAPAAVEGRQRTTLLPALTRGRKS